ncbi:MAG TPA: PH domain-containing protein [Micromonosporaceae bacterium]|nr:PH domain-containing protein [Micromonosporaceae bacterium]
MTEPVAAPADPQPAPDRISPLEPWPDTVAWRRVSPRLVWVELIELSTWLVVIVGALLAVSRLLDSRLAAAAAGVVAVGGILRAVAAVRAVRAWGYAERERDLLVRHGLLIRRLSIVPYARMQFVDVTAGPLERAFNLATVQLHTAAAASDARVPGLEPAEAARLRDRLTALGEDRAEGL